MNFTQWRELGLKLGTVERDIFWKIGDWWTQGRGWDRERVRLVRDPNWEGPAYQTCRNCASVAEKFPLSRRRDNLSFQHHCETAPLAPEDADRLLDRAENYNLSTRQLRALVQRARIGSNSISSTEAITDLAQLIKSGRNFGCIYADPPYRFPNETSNGGVRRHYDTMSIEAICALPVRHLAADDAHLHLWVTGVLLLRAAEVFENWGFEYTGSNFVWTKPNLGVGHYWRNAHEILLTGRRGNAIRFIDQGLRSWGEFDRTVHSKKPEEIRGMIERASSGPFLELFARRRTENWTVWGNQI